VCQTINILKNKNYQYKHINKQEKKMNDNQKQKKSFAEKHPRWNFIFGIILLLVIGGFILAIAYFILKLIGIGTIKFIEWIASISSTLDAVIVVALITGTVSIIGVIISKTVEYRQNKRAYLTQKREVPYGDFVDMIYKLQKNNKNGFTYSQQEMTEDLSKFSKQITLWGSKKVVNKWVEFRENSTNIQSATKNIFILEEIMNEMRKDLGLKKTRKGNLLAFFINDIKKIVNKKNQ